MANRADVVKRVAKRMGEGRRAARQWTDAMLDVISDVLCESGRLELRDLGVFAVRVIPPRETVDPRTA